MWNLNSEIVTNTVGNFVTIQKSKSSCAKILESNKEHRQLLSSSNRDSTLTQKKEVGK